MTNFNYNFNFPTGEFTIKELIAFNGFELSRINQIKCQRNLNRRVEKGELSKSKRGLEGVFAVVSEDVNVKGCAAPTPTIKAEDIKLEFPPVTYGQPTTITVGKTANGSDIFVTKTQKYSSGKGCTYTVYCTRTDDFTTHLLDVLTSSAKALAYVKRIFSD